MINLLSENFRKILRKNERNFTEQRGNEVYKIAQNPQAEKVLKDEKKYMESFKRRGGNVWKMPIQEDIQENGIQALKMPYYPGEVMSALREKIEKGEDYLPLLQQILELVTEIREKHDTSEQSIEPIMNNKGKLNTIYKGSKNFLKNVKRKASLLIHNRFSNVSKIVEGYKSGNTMKSDLVKRFGKYIIGSGIQITKDNVSSILDKKSPRVKMNDFVRLSTISLKNLRNFIGGKQDEYKIHGCLHLEHIRIDTDGKLVPIDFEHGAIYPRRHKYQDEAYIYQNLLQYFPNYKVANDFLVLWLRSVNMEDPNERELVKIALNEKILGGLYEMHVTNPERFSDGIKQHMNFSKDFDKKISEFRI